jgi:tripartite-type tricarboxylate transporter receptor subunit TctC
MTLFRAGAAVLGVLLAQLALAQTYPSKPVTLVVPFAAGGGTDIVARLIAERLREPLKGNVIVENRPGASAQIGNRYVIESAPDGHTLLVGTTSLINGPALFPKLPYDAEKQLRPVVSLADLPIFLAVSAKHNVKTVREFIDMAKKSGNLSYASAGPGTTLHMASEWLKLNGGFHATHIPFKGSAGAVVALGGGARSTSAWRISGQYCQWCSKTACGFSRWPRVSATRSFPTSRPSVNRGCRKSTLPRGFS